MTKLMTILFDLSFFTCTGQTSKSKDEDGLLKKILIDPSPQEIEEILSDLRKQDLSPKSVVIHDSILLSNGNSLYILSHKVESKIHYGAVIIPQHNDIKKLPVIVFATGGDGMHKEFDISRDFNHPAARFPSFLGEGFDTKFIVIIPSFRRSAEHTS